MALTPLSSSTPYITAAQVFDYYSRSIVADFLKATPTAPRPSYLAMVDPTNPAGIRLLRFLGRGAGEIESHCLMGKRYQPADLAALTGNSAAFLQGLNAARGMWFGYQATKPGTARPEDCPGAVESLEILKALKAGDQIFGFDETADAGLLDTQTGDPAKLQSSQVVNEAARFFGTGGREQWGGWPRW